ncbi:protein FAR1-RELATED SEQUENCE 5 [Artemisia annua]|uniref:Protein FAR1-RELATED SEQUENCE 5 n=1 Tax=Artemisia annua TaxID=35608 RepID=A0A2U1PQS9_ARTAN|nr:protein FAR1-RELATED SEQUENCE 5 [Artemisia annua]
MVVDDVTCGCMVQDGGDGAATVVLDSLHSSVSTSSEEIVVNDSSSASEEIAVSDDVSAKYAEEIVAYEHNDESEAIKNHCVHILSKDKPRLASFVEKLRLLKIDVEADCPNPPSKNKADNLEELVGVPKPAEKTVNNPSLGNPKGRKKLRIKGGKEQALDKNSKNRNACSLCGETDGHNRRTCPKNFAEEAELDQAEVTIEWDLDQS